jgi:hypothetical protein
MDRLLNNKETLVAINKYPTYAGEAVGIIGDRDFQYFTRIMVAQDSKTAKIVRAETLEEVLRTLNMRNVGGVYPEWAMCNKYYVEYQGELAKLKQGVLQERDSTHMSMQCCVVNECGCSGNCTCGEK